MNQRAAELNEDPEEYFEQMREHWIDHMTNLANVYFDEFINDIDDRPDITAFADYISEEGNEFEFIDYPEWFASEVSAVCDDYADYLRDKELGKD